MASILIADGHPNSRRLMNDSLHGTRHEVFEAEDGKTLVSVLRQTRADVIFTDRSLPVDNGPDLFQLIQREAPNAVVVVGVDPEEEDPREARNAGAYAVLSKPFSPEEFRRALTDAVSQSVRLKGKKEKRLDALKRFPFRRIAAGLLAAALLFAGGRFIHRHFFQAPPVRIFAVPYEHISGIAFDGEFLWCADWFAQSFYKHRMDALLSIERSFNLKDWNPFAAAWDGKDLWSASPWQGKFAQHAADTLAILKDFKCPAEEPSGLFFDGECFWMTDSKNGRIFKIAVKGDSLEIRLNLPSAGARPVGVYADAGSLWTADGVTRQIHQYDIKKDFKVRAVYALPDSMKNENISCFASDGKAFWFGTEGSKRIYRVHPSGLKKLQSAD